MTGVLTTKNVCIHCLDCIAFALLYAERNNLNEPPPSENYVIEWGGKFGLFKKFLLSTIANDPYHKYLPCKNALSYNEVHELADSLLKLTKKQKQEVRKTLLCHIEFKVDLIGRQVEHGLLVWKGRRFIPVYNYETWKKGELDSFSCKMPELIDFSLYNKSAFRIAKHLYRHATGSLATFYQYTYGAFRFYQWIGKTPDEIIEECQRNAKILEKMIIDVDDFVGDLKASGLAQGTISNYVKGVKALFRTNGLELKLPYKINRKVKYRDRAPTPEELTKVIDIADIREKAIVSLLALGGFRIGTLVKLQYRHIQRDLEEGRTPVHIHIESDITKGKYADYDTFIGLEAVEYLKAYLEIRRKGTRKIPPETITANSPLIRAEHAKEIRPLTTSSIHSIIHNLYVKAGLIKSRKRRYDLRPILCENISEHN